MRLSWKLGRVAGIDLFLHPSTLLIFLMVSGSYANPFSALPLVVGLLGSIVLHELGHALMARRYGIGTADITLYLFGGVARLERMPRSAGPELLIALAGPAVNVAIALALAPLAWASWSLAPPLADLTAGLLMINLGLAAFNLLPVFPMDGGRVLRALLSGWLGRLRATEVAASIGQALAIVGGFWFLFSGNWQAAILAAFVYVAAGFERAQVRFESGATRREAGFVDVPAPPMGFRWANRGGVWRLEPTAMGREPQSWN